MLAARINPNAWRLAHREGVMALFHPLPMRAFSYPFEANREPIDRAASKGYADSGGDSSWRCSADSPKAPGLE